MEKANPDFATTKKIETRGTYRSGICEWGMWDNARHMEYLGKEYGEEQRGTGHKGV